MPQIPWKLKSVAFAVCDRIGPYPLYLAQKYITRRASQHFSKIDKNWNFHRDNIIDANAKRIIEFGAGKTLVQNIYLSDLGIDQVVVDLNRMLDLQLVNSAISDLSDLGVPTKGPVSSIDDIQQKYRIRYIAPLDMQNTDFISGSFDACLSTNTLEHIPKQTIIGIWKETYRLLAPAGIVSAKIDYSDHYAHTDSSISTLNYLTFSEAKWRSYNHECHFQNRLRHAHHLELLKDAGFRIQKEKASVIKDATGLKIRPENLALVKSDYCTSGTIVAVK